MDHGMEYVTLNNRVKMPKLGFGVFQIAKEDCERCVLDAIEVGYRHIDTAQSYRNEEEVGNAIMKCGVPREELFITTKVWIDNYGYEKAKHSVLDSMKKLKTEYLDLVLLHQPFGDYYGAYRALQELYKEGKIRAIGVSNFYPDRLADMVAFNEIVPQVNKSASPADRRAGEYGKKKCTDGSLGAFWRGAESYVFQSGSFGDRREIRKICRSGNPALVNAEGYCRFGEINAYRKNERES